MAYEPHPVDTSAVKLGEELLRLTEVLARNTHDLWAQARLAEGWVYGPARDPERLVTPNLVPYDDLPDSEKEYDRSTALGTLRALVALGWRVVPPPG